WLNITDMFKFFHQTGDLQGKHNLPGEPMMDPVTGLFFAIGVAYALLRLRDQRRVLLLLWLVIGLAGSFMSSRHESPQAYRSLTALPAGILLAADALTLSTLALQGAINSRLTAARASRGRAPHRRISVARWLPACLMIVSLAAAGAWEAYVYFGIQARSIAVIRGFNAMENGVAHETITALESGKSVYVSPGFAQFSPLRFLVYGVYKARDGRNTLDDPPYRTILPATGLPLPAESGDTLMLLESQYWPLREYIQALYPRARIELMQLSDGNPLYVRVAVPAEVVVALQGLRLTTTFADGRTVTSRALSLEAPAEASATHAEWDGAIRLEHSGRYEFESSPGWQVMLDGRAFAGEGFLGQGLYRIDVARSPEAGAASDLRWRVDGGDWQSVPPSLLFDVPAERHGLLATYWTNPSWEGEPLFRQVTPFVLLSWSEGMLPAGPFSARFTGTLHISQSGTYEFQVEADDGARLLIDGSVLGEGLIPNQPNRFNSSASLDAGDHPIQLDYVQFGGGSALRLMWRHGDSPFEPVPPSALIPSLP
ncbi:MAG TPA: PA14 domain-containing protein, partial [Anaerolineales bacterium]|nr:PA14 domain-containing protein [Anaerolineales bacterium]